MSGEPLYGYSVKDITQLEVEIEELKRKRNTSIIIGSIIGGIAIIAMIVLLVLFIKECDVALAARDTSGLRQKKHYIKLASHYLVLSDPLAKPLLLRVVSLTVSKLKEDKRFSHA